MPGPARDVGSHDRGGGRAARAGRQVPEAQAVHAAGYEPLLREVELPLLAERAGVVGEQPRRRGDLTSPRLPGGPPRLDGRRLRRPG